MAIAEMEVKVSLEKSLNDLMREFALSYQKEYGVMIQDISFNWMETLGGNNKLIKVLVTTLSNG